MSYQHGETPAMNANTPITSAEFSYARAKMIIANPDAYSVSEKHRAAIWMLGWLAASDEDIAEACAACS